MEIFEFQPKIFLVMVNFYSRFPELRILKPKSENVIAALKSIFAVHGRPANIIGSSIP